jgi:dTDP-4-dehydrorhamnose 3,5-epimerase
MKFSETPLAGAYTIELSPFYDDRGWFVRTFSKDEFKNIGFAGEWVQMNHSFTAKAGTIRGMHYQFPPYREIKMVRCIRGEVFDVIIDLRKESPTFLRWFGIKLSLSNMNMIYIPEGFAHGFQALTDSCELIYSHSEFYMPGHEGGIRYDDTLVSIEWPSGVTMISDRDNNHPALTESFKGI